MGEIIAFASSHPLLSSIVAAFLAAVIAYEIWLRGRGLAEVPASTAVQLINKGATIIDVRPADAFEAGHIVNAKNVPLETLDSEPEAVKKPKNKVLLTVCDNGSVAQRAANTLRKGGFETVYALKGGLAAWRTDNLPLVK